jgi:biuret amidohydrolase
VSEHSATQVADLTALRAFDNFRGPPPELAGRRVGLIVVDLQVGSTHPEYGWLKFHRERGRGDEVAGYVRRLETTVFPNVRRLLDGFRQAGQTVVYLTVVSEMTDHSDRTPAYQRNVARWNMEGLPIPYAVANTYEATVREEVAPLPGEPVLNKVTASGFNSSNLSALVRNRKLDVLVFVGVATNFCVECTLRDAADLGHDCILVEDACAAVDEATHQLGVASMRPFAQVTTTDAMIAALDALSGAQAVPVSQTSGSA